MSNLPFLSKVLEKCLLKQFNMHCDNNNLLPDYYSAIDLSAVLNMVDHDILFNVLTTKFNVTCTTLKLLDSYLRPRHCKVIVNGHFSSNRELAFSVPQGSCAGLMLYTAYLSTMSEVVQKQISIHGYADDHDHMNSYRPVQHEEDETINNLKCVWWKSRTGWTQTSYVWIARRLSTLLLDHLGSWWKTM